MALCCYSCNMSNFVYQWIILFIFIFGKPWTRREFTSKRIQQKWGLFSMYYYLITSNHTDSFQKLKLLWSIMNFQKVNCSQLLLLVTFSSKCSKKYASHKLYASLMPSEVQRYYPRADKTYLLAGWIWNAFWVNL